MTRLPVLVGVDGSPASLFAVDLAVHESLWWDRPLRVVHADFWASHPAWVDTDPDGRLAGDLTADPQRIVQEAVDRAAAAGARVVSGQVVAGSPTSVLIRESAGAHLAVVGHRGLGGFRGLLLGSVALALAAHAHCPVLIHRGERGTPGGDVVVGVDGSAAGDPAVGFAFEEAERRGTGLLALHTWTGPTSTGPGDMLPLVYDAALVEAEEARLLERGVGLWREKFPAVRVSQRLARSRAPAALVEASRQGQLVVVGARGHGGRPSLAIGSVTHALLHHAGCPVASVRHAW